MQSVKKCKVLLGCFVEEITKKIKKQRPVTFCDLSLLSKLRPHKKYLLDGNNRYQEMAANRDAFHKRKRTVTTSNRDDFQKCQRTVRFPQVSEP